MLMAVVLFFILAFLFFIVVKYRGMYREASLLEQEKVLSTISKLADTAEFSCPSPQRALCIDADKIMVMKNREAYSGFFPVTSLSVVQIFPTENKTLTECTMENYPNCNVFRIYKKETKTGNEETISTFVSLCRKEVENNYIYDKCSLGKMVAGFEPKSVE